jgi:hypothetical protein
VQASLYANLKEGKHSSKRFSLSLSPVCLAGTGRRGEERKTGPEKRSAEQTKNKSEVELYPFAIFAA